MLPEKEEPKIVSNVALVVSKQMADEKESEKPSEVPMVRLDQFEWMRPINIAPPTNK